MATRRIWFVMAFGTALAIMALAMPLRRGFAQSTTAAAASDAHNDLNSAPNPYHVDEGWAKLGRKWGAVSAVDIDRDGKSVWVFDRCSTADDCSASNLNPVMKFDAKGNLVENWGAGMFVYPHGIYVDRDDNIWLTDGRAKNGKGQTVQKFTPKGKLLMTLGTPGVSGEGMNTFNGPSDVLLAPDGSIFVADGHGGDTNARIVKFTHAGKFIKAWGTHGTGTAQFDAPHALAMDRAGRLYVADRSNNRIQIFDQEGNFLTEWRQFGRPSGIYITEGKDELVYVADSASTPQNNPLKFKNGIRMGAVRDPKVLMFIPWAEGNTIEAVAVDKAGNIYCGFTNTLNFRRFVKD